MEEYSHRQDVINEINAIDQKIKDLIERKEKLNTLLKSPAFAELPSDNIVNKVELSPIEKIRLFSSFFRGRNDVYARHWTSSKTGRSGYSPVCANEWVRGFCNKKITKCNDCPNRELLPLTDQVIADHLMGKITIGVYPLLKNETCYFLALDFDKTSWQEDVSAFWKTCFDEGVPAYVERSRSGNGAHVWIFFETEVPAYLARRLGSYLITQTMTHHYKLDMQSYDRLFPNQDTMPKGGFGNLIALPFQKAAALNGNTLLVDKDFQPIKDQWSSLAACKRMSLAEVQNFAEHASESGQITGVRMSPVEERDPPWTRLPSGKRRYKTKINDLPDEINIVIADRIYIKTDAAPSVLMNQFKQLASFQNPEFYKKQKMRLSTFSTPRVICCAEFIDDYLVLPRGCLDDLIVLVQGYNVDVNIQDERYNGKKIKAKFNGTLNADQKKALRDMLKSDVNVFVAPPGSGKTVVAINTVAKRKTNVLILVHRKPLMEQWRLQLSAFLGIDVKEIGRIGGGRDKANRRIDIATIQSLDRKGVVDDRIADYGYIIVDECHHIGAVSFERVLSKAKAKYVLGLTATPYRRDGHQPIIHMQCGSITAEIKKAQNQTEISGFNVYPRVTKFNYTLEEGRNIYELWSVLINDDKRNDMIIDDIKRCIEAKRFPVILTERREHLDILKDRLENIVDYLAVLHGGLGVKKRREIFKNLEECSVSNKTRAILATGSYIGEGFDNPQLDTLFIAMPVSYKGKIIQYAGRLHRHHSDKNDVCIYDYVDLKVPVLERMYQRRLKSYELMGYDIKNEQLADNF